MIESKVDVAGNLIVNNCHGLMGIEEIKSWILESGILESPAHNIWNFADADLSEITSEDVVGLTRFLEAHVTCSGIRKTAVVVPDELSWGLGRIYQIVSETNEQLCTIELFKNSFDAQDWVDQQS